jgi:hypothetical protein
LTITFLKAGDPVVELKSGCSPSWTCKAVKRIRRVFQKQVSKNWPLPCIENYEICCRKIRMIIVGLFIDNANYACQTLQKD